MSDQASSQIPSIVAEVWDAIKKLDTKRISDWITLILKAAAGLGGFLLVAYAAKEHFFYDLSSLAAVALLLVVSVVFSFVFCTFVLYAVLSFVWVPAVLDQIRYWMGRLRGQKIKRRRPGWLKWRYVVPSSFLFLLMAFYITNVAWRHPIRIGLLHWAVMSGFLLSCLFFGLASDDARWRRWSWLVLATPVLLLFVSPGAFSDLLDICMIDLSFRSALDQYISISDSSYVKVVGIARLAGIQLSSCEASEGSSLLRGATLVWHGIGETSYLRVVGKSDSDASLLIPIPSSDVQAIYAGSRRAMNCGAPVRPHPS